MPSDFTPLNLTLSSLFCERLTSSQFVIFFKTSKTEMQTCKIFLSVMVTDFKIQNFRVLHCAEVTFLSFSVKKLC